MNKNFISVRVQELPNFIEEGEPEGKLGSDNGTSSSL